MSQPRLVYWFTVSALVPNAGLRRLVLCWDLHYILPYLMGEHPRCGHHTSHHGASESAPECTADWAWSASGVGMSFLSVLYCSTNLVV